MDDDTWFRPTLDGAYEVRLGQHDRELLHDLASQLSDQLKSGQDDGSLFRLYPPGYSDDLGRQVEYDRLMRDDLQLHHIEALRALQDTAHAEVVKEEELWAWVRAINQLRLVLGTRLEITATTDEEDIHPDDPRAGAFAVYQYLAVVLHEATAALSGEL